MISIGTRTGTLVKFTNGHEEIIGSYTKDAAGDAHFWCRILQSDYYGIKVGEDYYGPRAYWESIDPDRADILEDALKSIYNAALSDPHSLPVSARAQECLANIVKAVYNGADAALTKNSRMKKGLPAFEPALEGANE